MLDYVLKSIGSKRITLGSDYPFPLGDLEIGKYIDEMDLKQEVKEDIYCNASLEWLGMTKNDLL